VGEVKIPALASVHEVVSAYRERIAAMEQQIAEANQKFDEHTKHVGRFLAELHSTMIDPVDECDQMKISELCELLLNRAADDRQIAQDMIDLITTLKSQLAERDQTIARLIAPITQAESVSVLGNPRGNGAFTFQLAAIEFADRIIAARSKEKDAK
jgi:hypothetical protein